MKRAWVSGWLLSIAVVVGVSGCGGEDSNESGENEEVKKGPSFVLAKKDAVLPVGTKVAVSGKFLIEDVQLSIRDSRQLEVGSYWSTREKTMQYEVVAPSKLNVKVESSLEKVRVLRKDQPLSEESKNGSLVGIPMVVELKDGKWSSSPVQKIELNEQQQEAALELVDSVSGIEGLRMYGSEPRHVGQNWNVTPSAIPGMEDSEVSGTFKLSFDRLEEFDGHQCAVLIGMIAVTGTQGEGLTSQMSASTTIYRSIEHMVDLKMKIEGRLTLMQVDSGVQKTVRGPFTMDRERKLILPN